MGRARDRDLVPGRLDGLVLASASPRRRELLSALGVEFEVVVPEVEELADGDPESVVLENARRKARAGLGRGRGAAERLVLGVDTDVALDGRLLGKPRDEAEARERLEALSGRAHEVLSGVVLLEPAAGRGASGEAPLPPDAFRERAGVAVSEVGFRALDAAMLRAYLASGEWRDRAGGYAIQGLGSMLVETVRGDLSNVIGLPLTLLLELAPELGNSL